MDVARDVVYIAINKVFMSLGRVLFCLGKFPAQNPPPPPLSWLASKPAQLPSQGPLNHPSCLRSHPRHRTSILKPADLVSRRLSNWPVHSFLIVCSLYTMHPYDRPWHHIPCLCILYIPCPCTLSIHRVLSAMSYVLKYHVPCTMYYFV